MTHRLYRRLAGFALIPALALPGCNVGKIADGATVKTLAPGMIAAADVGLACPSGAALAPVMLALGHGKPLKKQAPKAEALTLIAAGMCAEVAAWEHELIRHQVTYRIHVGADGKSVGPLAEDALIQERRAHAEAARRNYDAFLRVAAVYGAPTDESPCPAKLKEREELIFLLGLTAGLLAVVHDIRSERQVGVPSALSRQVEAASECLDDERWHRVPTALRAAVWATIPGAAPAGADPWVSLEESAQAGEDAGLWLARALQAQAATSAGAAQEATLKRAITAHAAAKKASAGDPEYGLLNDYAARMILHFSDRMWIEARGHRTDLDQLGNFPEPAADEPDAEELERVRKAMEEAAAEEAAAQAAAAEAAAAAAAPAPAPAPEKGGKSPAKAPAKSPAKKDKAPAPTGEGAK